MLFVVKKKDCEEKRVVKANDYDELVQKAASGFGMNPNNAKLTFLDPRYGSIILDSQEIYEYIGKRRGEVRFSSNDYWPEIKLSESDIIPESAQQIMVMNA